MEHDDDRSLSLGTEISVSVPPPSPLTGCYLLAVIGEPHTEEHKEIILQRLVKGLLSWDSNEHQVDLEKELMTLTAQAPEGEDARNGERLIQFASENLVTEILIHPQMNTLMQCMRNLLSSFTRHRHLIHAGYTFAGNGSWIVQDGTFSLADFTDAYQENEVQRVIRAYENSISIDIHCSTMGGGEWANLPEMSFVKYCKLRVNPTDILDPGSQAIKDFVGYLNPYVIPANLEQLLVSSDVVGNIRFSHPTLYVFPGGQGDAALFGINGFNMLVDGGFSRKACWWDFARHLDRLDAVMLTRINNCSVAGMAAVLRRKAGANVYPQIGHFFCNLEERRVLSSPDGDKDSDPLLVSLLQEGSDMMADVRHINLKPQHCWRSPDPINLYHKVGHGTLDMYVLNPSKDSKHVREFLKKWHGSEQQLFEGPSVSGPFNFPIPNIVSICALLVWRPANLDDNVTRLMFPGSTPQHKIFEGLEKLKHLEFLQHPKCTGRQITSTPSPIPTAVHTTVKRPTYKSTKEKSLTTEKKDEKTEKESVIKTGKDRITSEKKTEKIIDTNQTEKFEDETDSKNYIDNKLINELIDGEDKKIESVLREAITSHVEAKLESSSIDITKKKEFKRNDRLITEKKIKRSEKTEDNKEATLKFESKKAEIDNKSKIDTRKKIENKVSSATTRSKSTPKTMQKSSEKKITTTTIDKKTTLEKSPPSTPKKSADIKTTKEPTPPAPARLKTKVRKLSPSSTPGKSTKEANNRRVVESKYKQASPKREITPKATEKKETKLKREPISRRPRPLGSPVKAVKLMKSPTKATKSNKIDPKLKGLQRVNYEDILKDAKKSDEENSKSIDDFKQDIDEKEEQEIVREIEAVFNRDSEADEKVEYVGRSDIEKITCLIAGAKTESTADVEFEEEYLIIEKEEIDHYTEESALNHELPEVEDELQKHTKDKEESEKNKDVTELLSKIQKEEESLAEPKLAESKEHSLSVEEKQDLSSEKKTLDSKNGQAKIKSMHLETQQDEKVSSQITVESGATTTAPTLPEDERITLDDIREDNQIEEKYVNEETKEIIPPQRLTDIPLEKKLNASQLRDIVKTPDEVADLPLHEEVDYLSYDDKKTPLDEFKRLSESKLDNVKEIKEEDVFKRLPDVGFVHEIKVPKDLPFSRITENVTSTTKIRAIEDDVIVTTLQKPSHAELVTVTPGSAPESPMYHENKEIKDSLAGKPLDTVKEYEGAEYCFDFTEKLRETHITTVESPLQENANFVDEITCLPDKIPSIPEDVEKEIEEAKIFDGEKSPKSPKEIHKIVVDVANVLKSDKSLEDLIAQKPAIASVSPDIPLSGTSETIENNKLEGIKVVIDSQNIQVSSKDLDRSLDVNDTSPARSTTPDDRSDGTEKTVLSEGKKKHDINIDEQSGMIIKDDLKSTQELCLATKNDSIQLPFDASRDPVNASKSFQNLETATSKAPERKLSSTHESAKTLEKLEEKIAELRRKDDEKLDLESEMVDKSKDEMRDINIDENDESQILPYKVKKKDTTSVETIVVTTEAQNIHSIKIQNDEKTKVVKNIVETNDLKISDQDTATQDNHKVQLSKVEPNEKKTLGDKITNLTLEKTECDFEARLLDEELDSDVVDHTDLTKHKDNSMFISETTFIKPRETEQANSELLEKMVTPQQELENTSIIQSHITENQSHDLNKEDQSVGINIIHEDHESIRQVSQTENKENVEESVVIALASTEQRETSKTSSPTAPTTAILTKDKLSSILNEEFTSIKEQQDETTSKTSLQDDQKGDKEDKVSSPLVSLDINDENIEESFEDVVAITEPSHISSKTTSPLAPETDILTKEGLSSTEKSTSMQQDVTTRRDSLEAASKDDPIGEISAIKETKIKNSSEIARASAIKSDILAKKESPMTQTEESITIKEHDDEIVRKDSFQITSKDHISRDDKPKDSSQTASRAMEEEEIVKYKATATPSAIKSDILAKETIPLATTEESLAIKEHHEAVGRRESLQLTSIVETSIADEPKDSIQSVSPAIAEEEIVKSSESASPSVIKSDILAQGESLLAHTEESMTIEEHGDEFVIVQTLSDDKPKVSSQTASPAVKEEEIVKYDETASPSAIKTNILAKEKISLTSTEKSITTKEDHDEIGKKESLLPTSKVETSIVDKIKESRQLVCQAIEEKEIMKSSGTTSPSAIKSDNLADEESQLTQTEESITIERYDDETARKDSLQLTSGVETSNVDEPKDSIQSVSPAAIEEEEIVKSSESASPAVIKSDILAQGETLLAHTEESMTIEEHDDEFVIVQTSSDGKPKDSSQIASPAVEEEEIVKYDETASPSAIKTNILAIEEMPLASTEKSIATKDDHDEIGKRESLLLTSKVETSIVDEVKESRQLVSPAIEEKEILKSSETTSPSAIKSDYLADEKSLLAQTEESITIERLDGETAREDSLQLTSVVETSNVDEPKDLIRSVSPAIEEEEIVKSSESASPSVIKSDILAQGETPLAHTEESMAIEEHDDEFVIVQTSSDDKRKDSSQTASPAMEEEEIVKYNETASPSAIKTNILAKEEMPLASNEKSLTIKEDHDKIDERESLLPTSKVETSIVDKIKESRQLVSQAIEEKEIMKSSGTTSPSAIKSDNLADEESQLAQTEESITIERYDDETARKDSLQLTSGVETSNVDEPKDSIQSVSPAAIEEEEILKSSESASPSVIKSDILAQGESPLAYTEESMTIKEHDDKFVIVQTSSDDKPKDSSQTATPAVEEEEKVKNDETASPSAIKTNILAKEEMPLASTEQSITTKEDHDEISKRESLLLTSKVETSIVDEVKESRQLVSPAIEEKEIMKSSGTTSPSAIKSDNLADEESQLAQTEESITIERYDDETARKDSLQLTSGVETSNVEEPKDLIHSVSPAAIEEEEILKSSESASPSVIKSDILAQGETPLAYTEESMTIKEHADKFVIVQTSSDDKPKDSSQTATPAVEEEEIVKYDETASPSAIKTNILAKEEMPLASTEQSVTTKEDHDEISKRESLLLTSKVETSIVDEVKESRQLVSPAIEEKEIMKSSETTTPSANKSDKLADEESLLAQTEESIAIERPDDETARKDSLQLTSGVETSNVEEPKDSIQSVSPAAIEEEEIVKSSESASPSVIKSDILAQGETPLAYTEESMTIKEHADKFVIVQTSSDDKPKDSSQTATPAVEEEEKVKNDETASPSAIKTNILAKEEMPLASTEKSLTTKEDHDDIGKRESLLLTSKVETSIVDEVKESRQLVSPAIEEKEIMKSSGTTSPSAIKSDNLADEESQLAQTEESITIERCDDETARKDSLQLTSGVETSNVEEPKDSIQSVSPAAIEEEEIVKSSESASPSVIKSDILAQGESPLAYTEESMTIKEHDDKFVIVQTSSDDKPKDSSQTATPAVEEEEKVKNDETASPSAIKTNILAKEEMPLASTEKSLTTKEDHDDIGKRESLLLTSKVETSIVDEVKESRQLVSPAIEEKEIMKSSGTTSPSAIKSDNLADEESQLAQTEESITIERCDDETARKDSLQLTSGVETSNVEEPKDSIQSVSPAAIEEEEIVKSSESASPSVIKSDILAQGETPLAYTEESMTIKEHDDKFVIVQTSSDDKPKDSSQTATPAVEEEEIVKYDETASPSVIKTNILAKEEMPLASTEQSVTTKEDHDEISKRESLLLTSKVETSIVDKVKESRQLVSPAIEEKEIMKSSETTTPSVIKSDNLANEEFLLAQTEESITIERHDDETARKDSLQLTSKIETANFDESKEVKQSDSPSIKAEEIVKSSITTTPLAIKSDILAKEESPMAITEESMTIQEHDDKFVGRDSLQLRSKIETPSTDDRKQSSQTVTPAIEEVIIEKTSETASFSAVQSDILAKKESPMASNDKSITIKEYDDGILISDSSQLTPKVKTPSADASKESSQAVSPAIEEKHIVKSKETASPSALKSEDLAKEETLMASTEQSIAIKEYDEGTLRLDSLQLTFEDQISSNDRSKESIQTASPAMEEEKIVKYIETASPSAIKSDILAKDEFPLAQTEESLTIKEQIERNESLQLTSIVDTSIVDKTKDSRHSLSPATGVEEIVKPSESASPSAIKSDIPAKEETPLAHTEESMTIEEHVSPAIKEEEIEKANETASLSAMKSDIFAEEESLMASNEESISIKDYDDGLPRLDILQLTSKVETTSADEPKASSQAISPALDENEIVISNEPASSLTVKSEVLTQESLMVSTEESITFKENDDGLFRLESLQLTSNDQISRDDEPKDSSQITSPAKEEEEIVKYKETASSSVSKSDILAKEKIPLAPTEESLTIKEHHEAVGKRESFQLTSKVESSIVDEPKESSQSVSPAIREEEIVKTSKSASPSAIKSDIHAKKESPMAHTEESMTIKEDNDGSLRKDSLQLTSKVETSSDAEPKVSSQTVSPVIEKEKIVKSKETASPSAIKSDILVKEEIPSAPTEESLTIKDHHDEIGRRESLQLTSIVETSIIDKTKYLRHSVSPAIEDEEITSPSAVESDILAKEKSPLAPTEKSMSIEKRDDYSIRKDSLQLTSKVETPSADEPNESRQKVSSAIKEVRIKKASETASPSEVESDILAKEKSPMEPNKESMTIKEYDDGSLRRDSLDLTSKIEILSAFESKDLKQSVSPAIKEEELLKSSKSASPTAIKSDIPAKEESRLAQTEESTTIKERDHETVRRDSLQLTSIVGTAIGDEAKDLKQLVSPPIEVEEIVKPNETANLSAIKSDILAKTESPLVHTEESMTIGEDSDKFVRRDSLHLTPKLKIPSAYEPKKSSQAVSPANKEEEIGIAIKTASPSAVESDILAHEKSPLAPTEESMTIKKDDDGSLSRSSLQLTSKCETSSDDEPKVSSKTVSPVIEKEELVKSKETASPSAIKSDILVKEEIPLAPTKESLPIKDHHDEIGRSESLQLTSIVETSIVDKTKDSRHSVGPAIEVEEIVKSSEPASPSAIKSDILAKEKFPLAPIEESMAIAKHDDKFVKRDSLQLTSKVESPSDVAPKESSRTVSPAIEKEGIQKASETVRPSAIISDFLAHEESPLALFEKSITIKDYDDEFLRRESLHLTSEIESSSAYEPKDSIQSVSPSTEEGEIVKSSGSASPSAIKSDIRAKEESRSAQSEELIGEPKSLRQLVIPAIEEEEVLKSSKSASSSAIKSDILAQKESPLAQTKESITIEKHDDETVRRDSLQLLSKVKSPSSDEPKDSSRTVSPAIKEDGIDKASETASPSAIKSDILTHEESPLASTEKSLTIKDYDDEFLGRDSLHLTSKIETSNANEPKDSSQLVSLAMEEEKLVKTIESANPSAIKSDILAKEESRSAQTKESIGDEPKDFRQFVSPTIDEEEILKSSESARSSAIKSDILAKEEYSLAHTEESMTIKEPDDNFVKRDSLQQTAKVEFPSVDEPKDSSRTVSPVIKEDGIDKASETDSPSVIKSDILAREEFTLAQTKASITIEKHDDEILRRDSLHLTSKIETSNANEPKDSSQLVSPAMEEEEHVKAIESASPSAIKSDILAKEESRSAQTKESIGDEPKDFRQFVSPTIDEEEILKSSESARSSAIKSDILANEEYSLAHTEESMTIKEPDNNFVKRDSLQQTAKVEFPGVDEPKDSSRTVSPVIKEDGIDKASETDSPSVIKSDILAREEFPLAQTKASITIEKHDDKTLRRDNLQLSSKAKSPSADEPKDSSRTVSPVIKEEGIEKESEIASPSAIKSDILAHEESPLAPTEKSLTIKNYDNELLNRDSLHLTSKSETSNADEPKDSSQLVSPAMDEEEIVKSSESASPSAIKSDKRAKEESPLEQTKELITIKEHDQKIDRKDSLQRTSVVETLIGDEPKDSRQVISPAIEEEENVKSSKSASPSAIKSDFLAKEEYPLSHTEQSMTIKEHDDTFVRRDSLQKTAKVKSPSADELKDSSRTVSSKEKGIEKASDTDSPSAIKSDILAYEESPLAQTKESITEQSIKTKEQPDETVRRDSLQIITQVETARVDEPKVSSLSVTPDKKKGEIATSSGTVSPSAIFDEGLSSPPLEDESDDEMKTDKFRKSNIEEVKLAFNKQMIISSQVDEFKLSEGADITEDMALEVTYNDIKSSDRVDNIIDQKAECKSDDATQARDIPPPESKTVITEIGTVFDKSPGDTFSKIDTKETERKIKIPQVGKEKLGLITQSMDTVDYKSISINKKKEIPSTYHAFDEPTNADSKTIETSQSPNEILAQTKYEVDDGVNKHVIVADKITEKNRFKDQSETENKFQITHEPIKHEALIIDDEHYIDKEDDTISQFRLEKDCKPLQHESLVQSERLAKTSNTIVKPETRQSNGHVSVDTMHVCKDENDKQIVGSNETDNKKTDETIEESSSISSGSTTDYNNLSTLASLTTESGQTIKDSSPVMQQAKSDISHGFIDTFSSFPNNKSSSGHIQQEHSEQEESMKSNLDSYDSMTIQDHDLAQALKDEQLDTLSHMSDFSNKDNNEAMDLIQKSLVSIFESTHKEDPDSIHTLASSSEDISKEMSCEEKHSYECLEKESKKQSQIHDAFKYSAKSNEIDNSHRESVSMKTVYTESGSPKDVSLSMTTDSGIMSLQAETKLGPFEGADYTQTLKDNATHLMESVSKAFSEDSVQQGIKSESVDSLVVRSEFERVSTPPTVPVSPLPKTPSGVHDVKVSDGIQSELTYDRLEGSEETITKVVHVGDDILTQKISTSTEKAGKPMKIISESDETELISLMHSMGKVKTETDTITKVIKEGVNVVTQTITTVTTKEIISREDGTPQNVKTTIETTTLSKGSDGLTTTTKDTQTLLSECSSSLKSTSQMDLFAKDIKLDKEYLDTSEEKSESPSSQLSEKDTSSKSDSSSTRIKSEKMIPLRSEFITTVDDDFDDNIEDTVIDTDVSKKIVKEGGLDIVETVITTTKKEILKMDDNKRIMRTTTETNVTKERPDGSKDTQKNVDVKTENINFDVKFSKEDAVGSISVNDYLVQEKTSPIKQEMSSVKLDMVSTESHKYKNESTSGISRLPEIDAQENIENAIEVNYVPVEHVLEGFTKLEDRNVSVDTQEKSVTRDGVLVHQKITTTTTKEMLVSDDGSEKKLKTTIETVTESKLPNGTTEVVKDVKMAIADYGIEIVGENLDGYDCVGEPDVQTSSHIEDIIENNVKITRKTIVTTKRQEFENAISGIRKIKTIVRTIIEDQHPNGTIFTKKSEKTSIADVFLKTPQSHCSDLPISDAYTDLSEIVESVIVDTDVKNENIQKDNQTIIRTVTTKTKRETLKSANETVKRVRTTIETITVDEYPNGATETTRDVKITVSESQSTSDSKLQSALAGLQSTGKVKTSVDKKQTFIVLDGEEVTQTITINVTKEELKSTNSDEVAIKTVTETTTETAKKDGSIEIARDLETQITYLPQGTTLDDLTEEHLEVIEKQAVPDQLHPNLTNIIPLSKQRSPIGETTSDTEIYTKQINENGVDIEQTITVVTTKEVISIDKVKTTIETTTVNKGSDGVTKTVKATKTIYSDLEEKYGTGESEKSFSKTDDIRSSSAASDDLAHGLGSPPSDLSSRESKATHAWGTESSALYYSDEDGPGSPSSTKSQIAHSPRSNLSFELEPSKAVGMEISLLKDPMASSVYGQLPDELHHEVKTEKTITKLTHEFLTHEKLRAEENIQDTKVSDASFLKEADEQFDKAIEEHKKVSGTEVISNITAKYDLDLVQSTSQNDVISDENQIKLLNITSEGKKNNEIAASLAIKGDSNTTDETTTVTSSEDPIESWGKPLGLPSPIIPPTQSDGKSTPKKQNPMLNKNKINQEKIKEAIKSSESPSKKNPPAPVYLELTYVPHHGNSYYSAVEFFKRVRARYYVFSGTEPSKEIYNALLDAKKTWEDKELEVTIIPTYDTDVLGYWVTENEDALEKYKIDLSPSASRCTINLQDHETSCAAYRLEF